MKLRLILRTIAASPWLTAFKVLAMGIGLAIGSFLLMRVARDHSVDRCFPDYERIYQVWTDFEVNGAEHQHLPIVATSLVSRIEEELGDYVESVSPMSNTIGGFITPEGGDRVEFTTKNIRPDFFDTFGVKILAGSASTYGNGVRAIWLDANEARRLFGNEDPVGRKALLFDSTDHVVAGVFEPIPEESTLSATILTESSFDWLSGCALYVKLRKGADPDEFNARLAKIWQSTNPDTESVTSIVSAAPLTDTFQAGGQMRHITLTLSVLAILVIAVTALNYVLLSLSSLARRAKAVGVQKCNGASAASIASTFALETALLMLGSLVVVAGVFFVSKNWCADTLGYSVTDYVATSRLWVLGVVMAVVFVVSALIPGVMMARIPVANVFRRFKRRRSPWKTALLALEICATAFTLGLTAVAVRQYDRIAGADRGYRADRMVMIDGADDYDERDSFISSLTYVEDATSSDFCPDSYQRKTNISDNAGHKFFGNYRRSRKDFFRVMGIPLIVGNPEHIQSREVSWSFRTGETRAIADAAVSRRFAEALGYAPEEAIGKTFADDESDQGYYQPFNIVAVYEDFVNASFFDTELPSLTALNNGSMTTASVRLAEPFEANVERLKTELEERFPNQSLEVVTYEEALREPYREVNSFRVLALLSSVVILLISAMGLLAYLRDEIARRTKEIAIRKINGAGAGNIVEMLAGAVVKVAVPSAIVGAVGAWWTGCRWMEQFADNGDSTDVAALCVASTLAMMLLLVGATALMTLRVARANPTESLRSE